MEVLASAGSDKHADVGERRAGCFGIPLARLLAGRASTIREVQHLGESPKPVSLDGALRRFIKIERAELGHS